MKINPFFPSILSTNFFNLKEKLEDLYSSGINYLHLDIMDGHFVNNLSFGPSILSAIKAEFSFIIDTHLMVSNPGKMIRKFLEQDSDWISFHVETDEDINKNIDLIKSNHKLAGLALNPDTDIKMVFPFLDQIDYVLLMSVFPGYGGQKFISETICRVEKLKEEIENRNCKCLIQVDGGINKSVLPQLKKAGADLFVIGTALFNSLNIKSTLSDFNQVIQGVEK